MVDAATDDRAPQTDAISAEDLERVPIEPNERRREFRREVLESFVDARQQLEHRHRVSIRLCGHRRRIAGGERHRPAPAIGGELDSLVRRGVLVRSNPLENSAIDESGQAVERNHPSLIGWRGTT